MIFEHRFRLSPKCPQSLQGQIISSPSRQVPHAGSQQSTVATLKGPCSMDPRIPRRLEGKVVIVTASTAGIGLGIATRLAQEGARVMISSRKKSNVDDVVQQLRAAGLDVAGTACHVGSAQQRQQLVQETLRVFGRVDHLVSNAAVNPASGPILGASEEAIDKVLDINIKAAILLAKQVAPHLAVGSAIVFVSSVTAFNPPPPIGLYAVSKTALLGLTRGLATELGPAGIRVNCLAPGIVPTKFSSALVQSPELEQAQVEATALKRLGRPEDMAAAAAFLLSDDSSYVTGETLVVSGGMQSRL